MVTVMPHAVLTGDYLWMSVEGYSAEKGEDLLLLDCHLPSMKVDFMFLMISCSQR